jgi:hypothetical protein
MENKILEKIKKLLSLATSSNEHEAQLASSKATELLTKYNLDMQSINFAEAEYVETNVFDGSRRKGEHKFICSILDKHFNVKVITITRRGGVKVVMVGDKTNVEVASYVFSFLENSFKQLFTQYRKSTGAPASARQPYYFGLYKGFCTQMEEAKTRAEQERGLMLVPDAALAKHLREQHPGLKTTSSSVKTGNAEAVNAGKEAGHALRVARGVQSRNNTGTGLLT